MATSSFPSGFVINQPWKTQDSTLVLDLKAYIANIRTSNNVLSTRTAIRSTGNLIRRESFILKVNTAAPESYLFTAPTQNRATILVSNYPVEVVLTNAAGTLNMGNQLALTVTSPVVSLQIRNVTNEGDAEVLIVQS